MLSQVPFILATFTSPEHIATDPKSVLWMFPLLAAVVIIYKATKMRVMFLGRFFKEVVILFCTVSVLMIAAAVALYVIVWAVTG